MLRPPNPNTKEGSGGLGAQGGRGEKPFIQGGVMSNSRFTL
jgi:hypothetical protein